MQSKIWGNGANAGEVIVVRNRLCNLFEFLGVIRRTVLLIAFIQPAPGICCARSHWSTSVGDSRREEKQPHSPFRMRFIIGASATQVQLVGPVPSS